MSEHKEDEEKRETAQTTTVGWRKRLLRLGVESRGLFLDTRRLPTHIFRNFTRSS